VVKESRKIRQWWVQTKLSLREVVQKLLGDPIEDAEPNMVCTTPQVPVVDPQAELEVGVQVMDALSVGDGEGHRLAHHQINHHAMGLEAVTTGSSVS
jgi:hypothetical protein